MAEIKRELSELGPLHTGCVSEQYEICGTPGCHCKDTKNPQKHGPYYQLGCGWRGRSNSVSVRPGSVVEMSEKVANYKRMREPANEWVDPSLEQERLARVARKEHGD